MFCSFLEGLTTIIVGEREEGGQDRIMTEKAEQISISREHLCDFVYFYFVVNTYTVKLEPLRNARPFKFTTRI